MKLATGAYNYAYFHVDLPLAHVHIDTGPRDRKDLPGIWGRAVSHALGSGALARYAKDLCRIMTFRQEQECQR